MDGWVRMVGLWMDGLGWGFIDGWVGMGVYRWMD